MPPLFPARLSWPAAEGGPRYRVVARNLLPDRLFTLETGQTDAIVDRPGSADLSPVGVGRWPEWRVQIRQPDGTWEPYLPYMDWPRDPATPATRLGWPTDIARLHRVIVHDDTRSKIVLKAATLETGYSLDWTRLEPGHSYRWRAQAWDDGTWMDLAPYRSLAPARPRVQAGSGRVAPDSRPVEPGESRHVRFLFTSDTEVHLRWMAHPEGPEGIQQQIFGRFAGQEVGIGLQMKLLDEYGFRGTFFIDVLAEYQLGDETLAPVFEAVLSRGHDVQLHLHPAPHLRFAQDEALRALSVATTRNDPALFRAVMELAVERFERRAGRPPVAYRAGAYRIFDSHFPVLRDFGIRVDSSVNPFKNCHVSGWIAGATQPQWVDGVLEVPPTWYLRHDRGWQVEQLAPVISSSVQHPAVAALAGKEPSPVLCYVAHSFSFLGATRNYDEKRWRDWNARWERRVGQAERDVSGYNLGAPVVELSHVDHRRIDTFHQMLDLVASRPGVEGISLAELAESRDEWGRDIAALNPIACYDGRAGRTAWTGARRYSESLLARLESSASLVESA